MTIKYWNSLEEGSRKRVLLHCFPTLPEVADMLLNEKPKKNNPWWKYVFNKVRIPNKDSYYKTVVNNTYIP